MNTDKHGYSKSFAHGWDRLNLIHPTTIEIVRLAALSKIANMTKDLSPAIQGRLTDAWGSFPNLEDSALASPHMVERAQNTIDAVQNALAECKLQNVTIPKVTLPSSKEFVPETFITKRGKSMWFWNFKRASKKFGQPVKA